MSKVKKSNWLRASILAGGTALVWGARHIKDLPPRPLIEARARAAAHSGPWTHGFVTVNGVRLHYAEVGSGPLVILLHGFPQCWYQWRYIMSRLSSRFRLVAPDMRGYNESDRPPGTDSYDTETLACDVVDLIAALGEERAHVVGHDWGGVVAWHLASYYPERVDKLAVINAPHPSRFARELARNPLQALRSLYALFFQLPILPEAVLRLTLRRTLPSSAVVPGAFPEEALDVYENAVAQPGAATTMLNYYRAAGRSGLTMEYTDMPPVQAPVLLLWGMKDRFLNPNLTEGLEKWVPDLRVVRIEECGHWVAEEMPGVAADELANFFGAYQA
jgi:pimeloyl-ACP methyl ester carboxylesterase